MTADEKAERVAQERQERHDRLIADLEDLCAHRTLGASWALFQRLSSMGRAES